MNDTVYNTIHKNLYGLIMDYGLSVRLHEENSEILNSASRLFSSGYISGEQLDKIESDFLSVQRENRKHRRTIRKVLSSYFAERHNQNARQFRRNVSDILERDLAAAKEAEIWIRNHIAERGDECVYDFELPFAIPEEVREALSEEV